MNKSLLKKIGFIAVLVVIISYFAIMLFKGNIRTDKMIDTEIATRYTYNDTITAECVIVRDETLLKYDSNKVLYYTVDDGDIVSAGAEVALVFSDEEDALNYKRINEVKDKISVLEELNKSQSNVQTDYSAIDKQIEINLKNIISASNTNSLSEIASSSDSLIYSVNQRQIITGEITDFNEEIASLNAQLQELEKTTPKYIDVVKSDRSGYFVASVDGYENTYDYANVTGLNIDNFSISKTPQTVSDDTIGKIVSGLNWYVVCRVSADDALAINLSSHEFTVSFNNTTCNDIPASLAALNQNSKQQDGIAVFRCNYMNTPISHLRNETVQIAVTQYSGIRISKEAIHDGYVDVENAEGSVTKKEVQGVYVLIGSELKFKEVSILSAGKDFVIIDETPDAGVLYSKSTVEINDEIVVRGEDLYDGKIIE